MRITVFGASGATGRQVVDQAHEQGHEVTAVVRDRSRLSDVPAGVTVVRAEVTDPETIGPAVAGADAVISAIGTRTGRAPTTVCADSTAGILTAMGEHGVDRLVVISASPLAEHGDGPVTRLVAKPILKRVLRNVYADMAVMERTLRGSDVDWTVVRPPQLTDGGRTGTYRTAVNRNVRGGVRISRADLADCMLRCLTDDATRRVAVSLGN